MLLHYLGKLIIQIICKYSADMVENANTDTDTDEYPSPVMSHEQFCGSVACPQDLEELSSN